VSLRFQRPRSWRILALRLLHVNVGLMLFGVGIATMLNAHIGVGPWDVFHQGLARRTPLSIGAAMIVAGGTILLISMVVARVRPGLGTLLNMALVGPWVDLFLDLGGIPQASGFADGLALFMVGVVLCGVATGLYITAGLGAGPRDGFALGIAQVLQIPVRRARTLVEVTVCLTGWLLGGTVGLGTIVFALSIGPLMQISLQLFGGLDHHYRRATEEILARRAARATGRPVA
jgi:uncharacterized protein